MTRPYSIIIFSLCVLTLTGCPDERGVGNNDDNPGDTTDKTLEWPSQTSGNDAGNTDNTLTITDAGTPDTNDLRDAGGHNNPPPPADTCTCPDGYALTPTEDACRKTITVAATNEGVSYEVCPAQPNFNYGKFGARYPDGTKVQSDYWGRDDGPSNVEGRQNEVGIWPCDGTTGEAGYQPTGEWIGFSHCIVLDTKSDYMVGIGGDNRVRLKLNGEIIFEDITDNTSAFNYWWLSALQIESGINIIEMQGYNVSGPASFGAEISGPFPPDSLGSDEAMIDTDYANNIVWSTGSMIGQNFDVGENSGWVCPDNYSLNLCTETPECTFIDVVPCNGSDGGL